MLKITKILFYINIIILSILCLVIAIMYSIKSFALAATLISTFGIYFPFYNIILILIKEIKKLDYQRYKYSEAYLMTVLIYSVTILYLFIKLEIDFNYLLLCLLYILGYIIITLIYIYLDYKNKDKKVENGPKFIKNN